MKLIICGLGLHDWETVCYAEYKDARAEKLAIPNRRRRRVCKECGKTQEQEVHCLGLQEGGKYTKKWVDVPRVKHDDDGKVEFIVDGAGALLIYDRETNTCHSVAAYKNLGPLEHQGNCTKLGKYAIAYPK